MAFYQSLCSLTDLGGANVKESSIIRAMYISGSFWTYRLIFEYKSL